MYARTRHTPPLVLYFARPGCTEVRTHRHTDTRPGYGFAARTASAHASRRKHPCTNATATPRCLPPPRRCPCEPAAARSQHRAMRALQPGLLQLFESSQASNRRYSLSGVCCRIDLRGDWQHSRQATTSMQFEPPHQSILRLLQPKYGLVQIVFFCIPAQSHNVHTNVRPENGNKNDSDEYCHEAGLISLSIPLR